jgi:hypothetical protein
MMILKGEYFNCLKLVFRLCWTSSGKRCKKFVKKRLILNTSI